MNDSLVFFRDRIYEMLFDYTIDIYRAPLLNTRILIEEYLALEKDARNGKIPEKRLDPVQEELLFSYKNDEVIKKILGPEERLFLMKKMESGDKQMRLEACRYLRGRLTRSIYYKELVDAIKDALLQQGKKKELDLLSRIFVSELYKRGYSYEYLFHIFNRLDDVPRDNDGIGNKFNSILDKIDFKERKYHVFIGISIADTGGKKLADELQRLFNGLQIIDFDDGQNYSNEAMLLLEKEGSSLDVDELKMCRVEMSGLDAFSAAREVSDFLDFGTRSLLFLLNDSFPSCLSHCLVREVENGMVAYPKFRSQRHKVIKPHPGLRKKLVEKSHRSLSILFRKTRGGHEFDRLAKALDLHNAFLTINNYQNSFLCLWSALEVLCDGPGRVNRALRSALELKYLARVVTDMGQKLSEACEAYISKRGRELEVTKDQFVFSVLFLSDWSEERDGLYEKLDRDPLVRNRLFEISGLNSGKKLQKRILEYGDRISWHIERMYRTRNSIVHSGNMPLFLDSLGQHLHIYLDVLLDAILSHFEEGNFSYVEDVIMSIEYEHQIYFQKLKDTENITLDDIEWLCW